jgi:hypothetical protein
VLSRFREPADQVADLIRRGADETERLVLEIAMEEADPMVID